MASLPQDSELATSSDHRDRFSDKQEEHALQEFNAEPKTVVVRCFALRDAPRVEVGRLPRFHRKHRVTKRTIAKGISEDAWGREVRPDLGTPRSSRRNASRSTPASEANRTSGKACAARQREPHPRNHRHVPARRRAVPENAEDTPLIQERSSHMKPWVKSSHARPASTSGKRIRSTAPPGIESTRRARFGTA